MGIAKRIRKKRTKRIPYLKKNPDYLHGTVNKLKIFENSESVVRIYESIPLDQMIDRNGSYKTSFIAFLLLGGKIDVIFDVKNSDNYEKYIAESPVIQRLISMKKSGESKFKNITFYLATESLRNDLLSTLKNNRIHINSDNDLDILTGDDEFASITYDRKLWGLSKRNLKAKVNPPKKASFIRGLDVIKKINSTLNNHINELEVIA